MSGRPQNPAPLFLVWRFAPCRCLASALGAVESFDGEMVSWTVWGLAARPGASQSEAAGQKEGERGEDYQPTWFES
jgi:hypothetical protein